MWHYEDSLLNLVTLKRNLRLEGRITDNSSLRKCLFIRVFLFLGKHYFLPSFEFSA